MDKRPTVLTVGTFDGLHRGHQAILSFLVEQAAHRHARPVVVTFDPHPREVVGGQHIPLLTTPEERSELIAAHGVEETVVLHFDREMATMPAERFVEEILVGRLGVASVVIGYDHGFGAGRRGNRELLERMGPSRGFEVDIIPAQQVQAHVVSSSAIRQALQNRGDVALAHTMLGRPYAWTGVVVEGDRRGRTIGYPTANLEPLDARKLIPLRGVYAVTVRLEDETQHVAMMNIGTRPTFDGVANRQEVHLLDYDGDLYGQRVTVEFRERLRNEQRFDGIEALVEQLNSDEARCRSLLAGLL